LFIVIVAVKLTQFAQFTKNQLKFEQIGETLNIKLFIIYTSTYNILLNKDFSIQSIETATVFWNFQIF